MFTKERIFVIVVSLCATLLGITGYDLTLHNSEPQGLASVEPAAITLDELEDIKFNPKATRQFIVRGDVILTDVDVIEEPGKPTYKYIDGDVYFVDQTITLRGKPKYTRKDVMSAIQLSDFLKTEYTMVGKVDPDIRIWPVKPLPPERVERDEPTKD